MCPLAQGVETITWLQRLEEPLRYHQAQLAACAMIGAALGLLGCFVVLRRMALIGDALSHAVLPGVVLSFIVINAAVGHLEGLVGVWGLFLGALLAGLSTSFGISWISRCARVKEDSAIGIVFTAMFAVGVILISQLPTGTHFDLKCFLFGEPLAIKSDDVLSIAIVSPLVLAFLILCFRPLKLMSFDPQMAAAVGVRVDLVHYVFMGFLAATVVAALRTVGVIMSVAMLITPAATAYQLTNSLGVMLLLAGVAGSISAVTGFVLAFVFNIPTGPAMVLVATALFGVALVFGREYGLVWRGLHRRRVRWHILEEDVLKAVLQRAGPVSAAELTAKLPAETTGAVGDAVRRLIRRGWLHSSDKGLGLTTAGTRQASLLVRSHRLWETYLAGHHVADPFLHEAAERLEHAHELAEDLASELGHPTVDPHGSAIPQPGESA